MRLDEYLVKHLRFTSRNKAKEAVKYGFITVNGHLSKPAYEVRESDRIEVKEGQAVSNGGKKLERAFDAFPIDVRGKTCVDAGASTGGFTEVLLHRGAGFVYAVDVGKDQLHISLRSDARVGVMDETNVRTLRAESFERQVEFLCSDLSFISLKLVLPVFAGILGQAGEMIVLIKPQFEAGREHLNKNGIVRDRRIHERVIEEIAEFCKICGLIPRGIVPAPLRERDMNREYLLWIARSGVSMTKKMIIEAVTGSEKSCINSQISV